MSDGWFKTGYGSVHEQAAKSFSQEFRIGDGEKARIWFLNEEPRNFGQHDLYGLKQGMNKYTCRAGMPGGCPLCDVGHKARFVGVFTIYDFGTRTIQRSESTVVDGSPQVRTVEETNDAGKGIKIYIQGVRVLKLLSQLHTREGGLVGCAWDIQRSGKSTDTTYNFMPVSSDVQLPPEVLGPDGKPRLLDMGKIYQPKAVEELRAIAEMIAPKLDRGSAPKPQPQQGDGAFTSGVNF
jgi:hypothetical protein